MGTYLKAAPDPEAMDKFYSDERPMPLVHTVWNGDFMGMCKHDICCPVCFDATAILTRNVTPGQWDQKAQPCEGCQQKGWRIRKRTWWDRFKLWISGGFEH